MSNLLFFYTWQEYLDDHFDAYVVVPGTDRQTFSVEDCSFPFNIIAMQE